MMYDNPLIPITDRLEIAIGGIQFRENIIKNLRTQIEALRGIADTHMNSKQVDEIQYRHLRLVDING